MSSLTFSAPPVAPASSTAGDAIAVTGNGDLLQRIRHARYLRQGVAYHIVCKTLQSFMLLAPDPELEVRGLVAGVIGRAQRNWPEVRLFAAAFLSNHFHLLLEGAPESVVPFIAFIKREISRRISERIGWSGPMWARYHASAVITEAAQLRCFKYIMGQGVKEGLVDTPEQWPGFHCAQAFTSVTPITGDWFDATAYGKAQYKEKAKQSPRPIDKRRYFERYPVTFSRLPVWAGLPDAAYQSQVKGVIDEVVAEGRKSRTPSVRPAATAVVESAIVRKDAPSVLPFLASIAQGHVDLPAWFTERRRLIAWDSPLAPEVRSYLDDYWSFQRAFRAASALRIAGDEAASFPVGAFRPGHPKPVAAAQLAAA